MNYLISVESIRRLNNRTKTTKLFKVWDIRTITKQGLELHLQNSSFLWSTEISATNKRLIVDEYKIFLLDKEVN